MSQATHCSLPGCIEFKDKTIADNQEFFLKTMTSINYGFIAVSVTILGSAHVRADFCPDAAPAADLT